MADKDDTELKNRMIAESNEELRRTVSYEDLSE